MPPIEIGDSSVTFAFRLLASDMQLSQLSLPVGRLPSQRFRKKFGKGAFQQRHLNRSRGWAGSATFLTERRTLVSL